MRSGATAQFVRGSTGVQPLRRSNARSRLAHGPQATPRARSPRLPTRAGSNGAIVMLSNGSRSRSASRCVGEATRRRLVATAWRGMSSSRADRRALRCQSDQLWTSRTCRLAVERQRGRRVPRRRRRSLRSHASVERALARSRASQPVLPPSGASHGLGTAQRQLTGSPPGRFECAAARRCEPVLPPRIAIASVELARSRVEPPSLGRDESPAARSRVRRGRVASRATSRRSQPSRCAVETPRRSRASRRVVPRRR